MKNILLVIVLITLASIGLIAQVSTSIKAEVDQVFALLDKDSPGVAAGIIKDGEVIYLKGFGSANLASKTPITPQSKFQLGEMSKQFTSLAILVLEEQGKIDLEEDVRKYLPELPEYAHTLTISHLLNHSSGLNDVNRMNTIVNGFSSIATHEEALNLIAAQKALAFTPGTDFSFHESVTESILMAEIVAKSSGQSFADFVKMNIFEPLGMKNSLIRDDSEAIISNVAEPYQKEEDEDYKKNAVLSSVLGAINAYSSAEDLAKWYLNFTHPNGNIGRLVQKLDTPVKLSNGKKFIYYWGEMVFGREFSHPERGLPIFWNFGLQGGYGCNVFRYIDQNIISFVLGNHSEYNGSLASNSILPLVEDLYLLPEVVDYSTLETKKLSTEKLKSFEGNYWYEKAGYASKLFVEDDTLRSQWHFSNLSMKLVPIGDNIFQQVATSDNVRKFKFQKDGNNNTLFFSFNDSEADVMKTYIPVTPSLKTLQSYAGIYYNENSGSLFSISIDEGKMILKNLNHNGIEFSSVKEDVFTSATMFMPAMEFIRDDSNRITSFKLNADGIHDLYFQKVQEE